MAKTRAQILKWYKQHNNVNVIVERGDRKYVHSGRMQDEDEAIKIDRALRAGLTREGLPYTVLKPDIEAINAFAFSLL